MDRRELEDRTEKFAIDVIRFVGDFSRSAAGQVIRMQLSRSGTSIGANYREANRAVSRRDFAYKKSIAEKEASERFYFLEICAETSLGNSDDCLQLFAEANELLAIFTSIGRSLRAIDRKSDSSESSRVSEIYPTEYGPVGFDGDIEDLLPHTMSVDDA